MTQEGGAALAAYRKLQPLWCNLLDDVGSIGHFVLDGDALLLDLLSSPRLDWQHGGQFLQLVWALEDLLGSLTACQHGHFRVVFFEQHARLWSHNASLRLARRLLLHHMRAALHLDVLCFDAWWDEDWSKHLAEAQPLFVLLTDIPEGSHLPPLGADQLAAARQLMQAEAVFHLSHTADGQNTQVAFLPELRFLQDVVFGFRCGALPKGAGALPPLHAAARQAGPGACARLGELQLAAAVSDADLRLAEVAEGGGLRSLWRTQAGVGACAALLSQDWGQQPELVAVWVYAWCLHEALLQALPLSQRGLRLPQRPEEQAGAAMLQGLPAFQAALAGALQQLLAAKPPQGEQLRSAADLLDGRLLHLLVSSFAAGSHLHLPERVTAAANGLMEAVRHAAQGAAIPQNGLLGEAVALVGAAGNGQAAAAGGHAGAAQAGEADELPASLRRNPLVQAFLGAEGAQQGEDSDEDSTGDDDLTALEPVFLAMTANDRSQIVKWKAAPLADIAQGCPFLQRRQLKLLAGKLRNVDSGVYRAEEAGRMRKELQRQVHEWMDHFWERLEQLQSRALRNYADTLSQQQFVSSAQVSAAGGRTAKGKPVQPVKGKQAKAPKLSKAEQIKQQNSARLQTGAATAMQDRWKSKLKEFEADVAKHGWATTLPKTEAFLKECRDAPEVAAAVVLFQLGKSVQAWKESCLQRKAAQAAAAAAGGRAPEAAAASREEGDVAVQRLPGAVEHAQAIWYTILEAQQANLMDAHPDLPREAKAALQLLGFDQAAALLGAAGKAGDDKEKETKKGGKAKGEKESKPAKSSSSAGSSRRGSLQYAVGVSEVDFQLAHCGHLLQRDVPADKDPRVASFNPDYWQRDVLDAVDADSSAVIVAPTSSGKTFISDYVFDRVKRQMPPGSRVVFVAPTKALVNQQRAQAARNFGTDQVGVFTRDFRARALDSAILITVPSCLEVLLMSPQHQDWVRSLRYVIFDEVHCMRDSAGGASNDAAGLYWEHCLTMIRCPFLALSATIGNPDSMQSWLQSVKTLQQKQDTAAGVASRPSAYEVKLIRHRERYADLRYHVVNREALNAWQKLDEQQQTAGSKQVREAAALMAGEVAQQAVRSQNPCSALSVEQLRPSFPSELAFEPRDSLQLHGAMQRVLGVLGSSNESPQPAANGSQGQVSSILGTLAAERQQLGGDVEQQWLATAARRAAELAPAAYFTAGVPILRTTQGASSARDPGARSQPSARSWEGELKAELSGWAQAGAVGTAAADAVLKLLQADGLGSPAAAEEEAHVMGQSSIHLNIVPLLRLLSSQQMLPAMAFNLDRTGCEQLAEAVVTELELLQNQRRADPEYQRQVKEREAAAEAQQRQARQQRDKKVKKRDEEAAQDDAELMAGEVEEEIDPQFSFGGRSEVLTLGDVHKLIDDSLRYTFDEGHVLRRAIKRGIGVHHEGLHNRYRQLVEILFRAKFLRMVFATGTLAYGINMPCRTVVFAGDHLQLNSLAFRQMAGRAGRRGFDNLGYVVFLEVPHKKIANLQVSPVPYLFGYFPLSATLSLRLLALTAADAKDAARRGDAVRLLSCPFYAHQDPQAVDKMHALFRFSLDYLQRRRLVTGQGAPSQPAAFADQLFWQEPGNLAVSTLMRAGVLQRLCAPMEAVAEGELHKPRGLAVWDQVAYNLLHVLAHLFEQMPLRSAGSPAEQGAPSIQLPPLDAATEGLLDQQGQEAFRLFTASLASYAAGHQPSGAASKLPLSGLQGAAAPEAQAPPSLAAVKVCISSHYAALSGHGDEFAGAADLAHAARRDLLVSAAAVPSLRWDDRHGRLLPLNSYVLDYWVNQDKVQLVKVNGIPEGMAWEGLNNLKVILKGMDLTLKHVPGRYPASTVTCIQRLHSEFEEKHDAFNLQ